MSALSRMLSAVPPAWRPFAVAILAIAVCLVLFRPRNKPQRPADGSAQDAAQGQLRGAARGSRPRGLPALSMSTVGCIIEFRDGRPQPLPGASDALRRISAVADIFLVTQLPTDSDALEAATMDALSCAGVFGVGGCDRRKAMFCSTEDGRSAMIRQLAPATHLDTSPKVLRYLAPHLPRVVYVDAANRPLDFPESSAKASIISTTSIDDFASQL